MTGSFRISLVNMGTRSAAFTAKLRSLHDFHLRLLTNQPPFPTGGDIANTLKYFSATLLNTLKDIPSSPLVLIKDPTMDQMRMSFFPNLEYQNLFNALAMLIDVAPVIQHGLHAFGRALLQCFGCILSFLDKDLIDNLPYMCASTISVLPPSLHQDIVNYLCYYILPFTITRSEDDMPCQACQSVSSVLMLVFQYSNNPAHHCQLLECLMSLKQNVVKDLLCVIAYGTASSRSVAAKLLFYYWPAFNADLFDRKVLLCKFASEVTNFTCQRDKCPNTGNAGAVKVCYDHCVSIRYATESPLPLYLCVECGNEIHRDNPDVSYKDLLHPMQQVSMICENKNCRSIDKSAFSICFSNECTSYNGNHAIRYCEQCNGNRHNSRRGFDHIVHRSLLPAWEMDLEMQMYMVEAVISLMREAKPLNLDFGRDLLTPTDPKMSPSPTFQDNISLEDRQQLGKYGIWLLVGRCTPTPDTPVEILGRLLSMLFHWFHITACASEGHQVESTLEKLKIEHVCGWLREICVTHYKDFIACLLPHPPEHSRVGGHWDTLASRTSHLREGLQRLICLVPYDVISQEIWDYVMPHWMEAITNDVPEKELTELKIVLSKILDPDMSPLGFDAKAMYNFVSIRFEKTTTKVQQQALHWLQILTKLEILIPLSQLFAMFTDGVRIMKHGVQMELMKDKEAKGKLLKEKENPARRSSISPVVEDEADSMVSDDEAPANKPTEFSTDAENNLTCCILMLDILLKQMELQDVEQHMGINTSVCENVCKLLKCMVTASSASARGGLGNHMCSLKSTECAICESSIMWQQLSAKLVQFMAPRNPIRPPDQPIVEVFPEETARKSPPDSEKEHKRDRDVSLSMAALPIPLGPLGGLAGPMPISVRKPDEHSIGGVLVQMPHVCSTSEHHDKDISRFIQSTDEIMTATMETVAEQLDLAAIMPSEKVVSAVARSITLSDADVATATVQVAKPQIVGDHHDKAESVSVDGQDESEDGDDFWHTSVGKFKFSIDALPQPLQYIHQLLVELPNIEKPDILYYMLQCLNVLVLHGDAFTRAARDHRGFFIWCQENLLIKNLWDVCNAENSHICQAAVPLLLHCITLPLGNDSFWRVLQDTFHHSDWRVRFQAVERVTVIARFMDSTPLRGEISLQAALATAFCHLIAAMDDINVYVAQRSTLYLGTIHDLAIKSLLYCLESQFDTFIVDRPVVLQSVYQLHNSLSDRKVLTWEFFLNRFETLFVEAQINLEKNGDILYMRDLRNSENGSEILSTRIQKAREALSQSDGSTSGSMTKTLSASFGTKWPYKRTMSAPATTVPRQESKIEKEKIYNRQISAPLLKRKTSRFGLGQFLSGNSNNVSNIASHAITHSHHLKVNSTNNQNNQLHPNQFAPYYHHSSQPNLSYPPLSPLLPPSNSNHLPTTPILPTSQHHQEQQTFFAPNQTLSNTGNNTQTANTVVGATDNIHSFGGQVDEITFSGNLFRVVDLEEADKETIHLLVFLLMQFMSRMDLAYPTDEKPMCRVQAIVLKHLYLLLGYNQNDRLFQFTAQRLRESAVFNVFLANLPQVLDQNSLIGEHILPVSIHVLLYAPNPVNLVLTADAVQSINYSYSLWYLEPHVRRNWLMSLLVILYKYQYQPPLTDHVQNLVRIVMNSLDAQFHQCKRIPATVVIDIPPRRDLSQPSLGTENEDRDQLSPPASPQYISDGAGSSKGKQVGIVKPGFRKYQDSSLECDDETESELVAIPESDLSDSTLHGSAPGSFDDAMHFEDICSPLKPEVMKHKGIAHMTTAANLSTAQVAMSPLAIADRTEERSETIKKIHRMSFSVGGPDKSNNSVIHSTTTTTIEATNTTSMQSKCSLSEGVRMMVTSSMLGTEQQAKAQAILNPPVNVQKAIVVSQNTLAATKGVSKEATPSSSMFMANLATSQFKTISAVAGTEKRHSIVDLPQKVKPPIKEKPTALVSPSGPNWMERRSVSPVSKTLGRQQRIIETSVTPATTPIQQLNMPSTSSKKSFRHIDRNSYGSPESPLSKMDLMSPPTSNDTLDGLLSPSNLGHLEIPTPERLLPIGQHGKDGMSALVDKVREALTIPDISHLRQDSLERSESIGSPKEEMSSRANSPRRLIKQVALLESPPNASGNSLEANLTKKATQGIKIERTNSKEENLKNQRQRFRKVGPFAIGSQSISDSRNKFAGSWAPSFYVDDDSDDEDAQKASFVNAEAKTSSFRVGDDCITDRCTECGVMKEEFTDEELGLMIVILGTFIHREPLYAAAFLPDILVIVSRVAVHHTYSWQCESSTHLPGGSQSVAHQFIRCVLHQLAPNGVFYQIFLTQNNENVRRKFFKSIASALNDFTELNPASPVILLTETINSKKTLPIDVLPTILRNLSEYLQCIHFESNQTLPSSQQNIWTIAVQGIEALFRRLVFILPQLDERESLLDIMVSILKMPSLPKSILDPFSKILGFAIQNLNLKHKVLHDLCVLNNRAFTKERDKHQLCRQIVFELVQALKFKINIPDRNLLLLVGFVLQDAGGALPKNVIEGLPDTPPIYTNNASECMKQYLNDVLEFLADFHTLSKIKNFKNGAMTTGGLSEDTLGGCLKGAVAQYLALEMSRGNSKENRTVSRYLPWLYNAPTSLQQGPKEFTECICHMRLLSWLLMGSLTHTALLTHRRDQIGQHGATTYLQHPAILQPVPQDASCHIADHIQVIFAGFAEQSKASVLHMSSMFHAFTLCQLWTVYLEQISHFASPQSDTHSVTMGILFEFWAKVTPCILQLVAHSKLAEMVNLHFLSLLEALRETRSTCLAKLLPLWSPVLSSTNSLSGTLHVRLVACRDVAPETDELDLHPSDALLKWLQRVQFKMGQIEYQSSTATQFYSI